MTDQRVVEAGEHSAEMLIEWLTAGQRVVIRTEFLDATHEVTLRWDGDTYYCDTPTRLHRHSTAEEMRHCMHENGYAGE